LLRVVQNNVEGCIGFLLLVGVDECSNECDDDQWTGTGFG